MHYSSLLTDIKIHIHSHTYSAASGYWSSEFMCPLFSVWERTISWCVYSEPGFASALDMVFPHRIPIYFGSNAIYKISWIYCHYLLDINCSDITTATFILLQAEYFNYCLVFRSPRKPSWPRRRRGVWGEGAAELPGGHRLSSTVTLLVQLNWVLKWLYNSR